MQIKCEHCGTEFERRVKTQRFCGKSCRVKAEGKRYRKRQRTRPGKHEFVCNGCGKKYTTHRKERDSYCSRECAFEHSHQWHNAQGREAQVLKCDVCSTEYRISDGFNYEYCSLDCRNHAYQAECDVCGSVFIRSTVRDRLCSDDCRAEDNRRSSLAAAIEQHKQKATVHRCRWCGREFCPLYGSKMRSFCCKKHARKFSQRQRHLRGRNGAKRAKYYGAKREYFNVARILQRDGWRCYICGIDTPRDLRGTIEHNAPEIDHVVPLAGGGSHTKDNVRCSCRHCNILKADMTLEELEKAHRTTLRARREYASSQAAERRREEEAWRREAQTVMSKRRMRWATQLALFGDGVGTGA